MSALDDIIKERLGKKEKLIAKNINPYPEKIDRNVSVEEVLEGFDILQADEKEIGVVGRVMSIREHGALIFFHLKENNDKIQVLIKKDLVSEESFELFRETIDMGDFVFVVGKVFTTKTNEKTIEAKKWQIVTKAILPIPTEFYGLEDIEEKYRKRYLDLLLSPEVKRVFDLRWKIIAQIREFLGRLNFTEVETPVLQSIYGGTLAKPFMTHLNDLEMDVYLRIAPELFLKRILIAGYTKIYEIGKCFRNESIDRDHNPEFTLMELYQAFASKEDLMQLIENLIEYLADKNNIEFLKEVVFPLKRVSIIDYVKEKSGLNYFESSEEDFAQYLKESKIEWEKGMSKAKMFDNVFKKFRMEFKDPVFVIDHPIDLSPLAKAKDEDKRVASRFQFLMNGLEICNGWSELNDPAEQKARFKKQEEDKKAGDKEAHPYDSDFLEALEYGMPMAAGVGIGIDRLVTVLSESTTLRDTIMFPFMKKNN